MIIRLSQKLNAKLKSGPLVTVPLHDNPFVDWTAHLFTTKRAQYILLCNTKSLYCIVMYAKGITNDSLFMERTMNHMRDFMQADGQEFAFQRMIAPAAKSVRFAKALNRTVTGSMNDLVKGAKYRLEGGDVSPFEVGLELNETPMSALELAGAHYCHPKQVFQAMVSSIKI